MANKGNIVNAAIRVSIITFLIKLLGLAKQSVIASVCGATQETDAFFIATGILTQLCAVFFSSITISLLTIHTNVLINDGREESNRLLNGVIRVFIPISLLISFVFWAGAPLAARFFAPAYKAEQLVLLTRYIRIMASAFVFWCYSCIINVILETDKRFLPSKGQSFFQNLFLILAAVLLYPKYGMTALVYGFLLSGIAQCILVTWCARKSFHILFSRIDAKKDIFNLLRLSIPLILGNAIYEINDIVDKQISTGLGDGNVSYLNYGGTLNEIVTGIIVSSITIVLFSHFATWIAKDDRQKVEQSLTKAIEYLTILILPVMIMCIISGDIIVSILYGRGSFQQDDILSTYGVVIGYALGFVFQAARANLVRVYYAFQDTKTPMVNGMIAVAINITMSIILSKVIGVSGIAVATSIAMLVATVLLSGKVKQYLPNFSLRHCYRECAKGIVAGIITSGSLLLLKRFLHLGPVYDILCESVFVVAVYGVSLALLKAECITVIRTKLFNR